MFFDNTTLPNVGRGHLNNLPEVCADGYWTDTQIVIKVPSKHIDDSDIQNAIHNVRVQRSDLLESRPQDAQFKILSGQAGPGICKIEPNQGPADGALRVHLYGERFGNTQQPSSKVEFTGELGLVPATSLVWSNNEISDLVVPVSGADPLNRTRTGEVQLTNDRGDQSNGVLFTVADCRVQQDVCAVGTMCCNDGTCSASCGDIAKNYNGWVFTTGEFASSFQVVQQCFTPPGTHNPNGSPRPHEGQPTPSPSRIFPNGNNVCINARLQFVFNDGVSLPSLNAVNVLNVESCGTGGNISDTCTPVLMQSAQPIAGLAGGVYVLQQANALWNPTTWYRVTLDQQVRNAGLTDTLDGNGDLVGCHQFGVCASADEDDYVWTFKTGTQKCALDFLDLTPSDAVIEDIADWIDYSAIPAPIRMRAYV